MRNSDSDWRVDEGPAIGIDPVFDLSAIGAEARFYAHGSMSRRIIAKISTPTPTMVESLGRPLATMSGLLTIFDSRQDQTGMFSGLRGPVEPGANRGALGLTGLDRYAVHLYLPPDQFAALLSLFAPAPPSARLRIEVERTLNQGLFDEDSHFWNDRLSPVVLFNAFDIILPDRDGSYG